MDLNDLFLSRPFQSRNAEEHPIAGVLNLFVNPIDGLTTPFDYENAIIKGRMGSGKTMYLRANLAYYLSMLVPSIVAGDEELILPVLIRLNDFQHLSKPKDIYQAFIIKLVEELSSIYIHLEDAKEMAEIHTGMSKLYRRQSSRTEFSETLDLISKLKSEEYIEKVSQELGITGGIKPKFFEMSSQWKEGAFSELKNKPNPGIKDVEECYESLLRGQEGKILLLIDEAGSLSKSFFRTESDEPCFFEILMNQLRTASYIRTKIAVYPNTPSDMLTETRYGDAVLLESSVRDAHGYTKFRKHVEILIRNYLNPRSYIEDSFNISDLFETKEGEIYGDSVEQLIYASNGNMRRLIQLLDLAMNTAYSENNCAQKIDRHHVTGALMQNASNTEALFSDDEIDFLNKIVAVCKARGTFKFKFPNMSLNLYKYTSKSQEYNIMNVDRLGSGRRGTVYSFDYAYAVLKDVPTHHIDNTEKIHRERSLDTGKWVTRVATINQELIDHAALAGKLEGEVVFVRGDAGFIKSDVGEEYFYAARNIIDGDQGKIIMKGKRVRFLPTTVNDSKMAEYVEIL